MDEARTPIRFRLLAALAFAAAVAVAPVAAADDAPPVEARVGLALASEAARAWAPDAALVWVENDEAPGVAGASARWGYLFYSASGEKARAYSVKAGKIVTAECFQCLDCQVEYFDDRRCPPLVALRKFAVGD